MTSIDGSPSPWSPGIRTWVSGVLLCGAILVGAALLFTGARQVDRPSTPDHSPQAQAPQDAVSAARGAPPDAPQSGKPGREPVSSGDDAVPARRSAKELIDAAEAALVETGRQNLGLLDEPGLREVTEQVTYPLESLRMPDESPDWDYAKLVMESHKAQFYAQLESLERGAYVVLSPESFVPALQVLNASAPRVNYVGMAAVMSKGRQVMTFICVDLDDPWLKDVEQRKAQHRKHHPLRRDG